jgi:hypothetical protein
MTVFSQGPAPTTAIVAHSGAHEPSERLSRRHGKALVRVIGNGTGDVTFVGIVFDQRVGVQRGLRLTVDVVEVVR